MTRAETHRRKAPGLLAGRLATVVAEREAVLSASDPESVHRMRVASRRLRAALRVAASGLGEKRAKRLLDEAREVTRALGPWREAEVSQALLEEVAATAMGPVDLGLAYLRAAHAGVVGKRRDKALARLRRVDFARFAHKLAAADAEAYGVVHDARRVLAPLVAEVETAASVARRGWRDADVHRLRIAAKRLRYTVELVGQRAAAERFATALKRLQDALGRFHDVAVLTAFVAGEEATLRHARIASLLGPVAAARACLAAVKVEALEAVVLALKSWPRGAFRRLTLALAPAQPRPGKSRGALTPPPPSVS